MRAVLQLMRTREIASVAEISSCIRLSKTTIKKIIDHLSALNLVVSAGKGLSTGEGGKKPELFRFNRSFGYVISIHVTPDSISLLPRTWRERSLNTAKLRWGLKGAAL